MTTINTINSGYGDYVIYKKGSNGNSLIKKADFQKAYDIFCKYSPENIAKSFQKVSDSRFKLIDQAIKQLDSDFEIVFIPRTLYELILIRKGIEEDEMQKSSCPIASKNRLYFSLNQARQKSIQKMRNCWHLFEYEMPEDGESDITHIQKVTKRVKKIAFRLNNEIVQILNSSSDEHSLKKINSILENQINFFQEFYQKSPAKKWEFSGVNSGPSLNFGGFGQEKSIGNRVEIMSLCINNEKEANILRKIVQLECSEQAKEAFFLYRGARFDLDSPTTSLTDTYQTLSYGTGLFSGGIFDVGATPFFYMKKTYNDAFITIIPYDKYISSPFLIESTNPICQLHSFGETFHARSKLPDLKTKQVKVIGILKTDNLDYLDSHLSIGELTSNFRLFHNRSFIIKNKLSLQIYNYYYGKITNWVFNKVDLLFHVSINRFFTLFRTWISSSSLAKEH